MCRGGIGGGGTRVKIYLHIRDVHRELAILWAIDQDEAGIPSLIGLITLNFCLPGYLICYQVRSLIIRDLCTEEML